MKILPLLGGNSSDPTYLQYVHIINYVLEAFVPTFFEEENIKDRLERDLPFLLLCEGRVSAENISFFLISKSRPDGFKFFFDMIYRWLVPGENLNVVMIHAVDFTLPQVDQEVYTLSEIVIRVTEPRLRNLIDQALPLIESEIKRGVASKREAVKILESKGYKQDEKTAILQEKLGDRLDRFPSLYQPDLLREMQHTLLLAPEGFKAKRSVDHLLKLIIYQYRFRKDLLKHIENAAHKRRVFLKLIQFPFEGKTRVGVVVGMNFLEEKEIFEEKQLVKALNHHFPFIRPSEGSSLYTRRGKELLTTVYTEIEHSDGGSFSMGELSEIEKELPQDLLSHVEYSMHPVFMPRNEEEIMKNILVLAGQIKYVQDITQGFISFDQQTRTHLFFTVILVRVVRSNTPAISDLFELSDSLFSFIPDRVKILGSVGKKHVKEATVFRLKIKKEHFLRLDHSIDLYKARQLLVDEVTRTVGVFRDFNGGMIAKRGELLDKVKEELRKDQIKFNAVWLENFFYSLNPSVMQTLLNPRPFCKAFTSLSKALKKGLPLEEAFGHKIEIEEGVVYVFFLTHERHFLNEFEKAAKIFQSPLTDLVLGEVSKGDTILVAAVYRNKETGKQKHFIQEMEKFFSHLPANCTFA